MRSWIIAALLCASVAGVARAQQEEITRKNLVVLTRIPSDELEGGMKMMTLALGLKCTSCHVRKEYALDDVPAKLAARKYFKAALAEKDRMRRLEAIRPMLDALQLSALKSEPKMLVALDLFSENAARAQLVREPSPIEK